MAAKKLLAIVLRERSESIIYRKVRKELMDQAQNNRSEYIILQSRLDDYALTRLQNEGILVAPINENGHHKYKLTW